MDRGDIAMVVVIMVMIVMVMVMVVIVMVMVAIGPALMIGMVVIQKVGIAFQCALQVEGTAVENPRKVNARPFRPMDSRMWIDGAYGRLHGGQFLRRYEVGLV